MRFEGSGQAAEHCEAAGSTLMNDADVCRELGVSRSWVRKQRHLRKRGLPHQFIVDPVYVTERLPRYRRAEVTAWLAGLSSNASAQRGTGVAHAAT